MNIKIVTKKTTLTDGIKEAIEHELSVLNKYINNNTVVNISIEILSNTEHKITVHTTYDAQIIKAESIEKDLYLAINKVADKLEKQVRKINDINKSLEVIDKTAFADSEPSTAETTNERVITKRKRFDMKPMLEDEAILQMELLGHTSFMFFNAELNTMCLIYKKKNNCYGIIEGLLEE